METQFEAIEPNVWKPKQKEESIEGVLISKHTGVGANKSNTYHVDTKEGQKMVWGSTILDDRMEFVSVGDIIRITFKGQEKNSKGQPINIFKVERAVSRAAGPAAEEVVA